MSRIFRAYFIVCFLMMLLLSVNASAQRTFEGQVIDKETEITLPGVTVKLLKEGRATISNSRGYFKFQSVDSVAHDSLQFTSIGYKPLRMAVSAYQKNMFVELEASNTQLKNVSITDKKKKIPALNKFSMADIRENKFNATIPFWAQYMLAVQMKAPKKHCRITNVKLGRRDMDTNLYPRGQLALPSPYTRFLIHVMSMDPKTGKPGNKIYTKQVSLTDNALIVDVDVNEDNWVMDTDVFFIAVEWQRAPINEILVLDAEELVRKTTNSGVQKLSDAPIYRLQYQPALVVFIDGIKFTAYYMDEPGVWQPYKLQMIQNGAKYDTHVAISAGINY